MQKGKIGCGLITCDRIDFFKKSYFSISNINNIELVVVNDGNDEIIHLLNNKNTDYIKTKGREGVAIAKNKAMQYLLDIECEHIFLMEDDIEIIDNNVFEAYINISKSTGLKHLNYGLHGNHNRDAVGNPTIIKTVNYGHDISIDLYPNVLGAFSYYHRTVLEDVGLMPTCYFNALEHVCQTYRASKSGYTSPWRYFADIHNSSQYIKDIVPDHQQSKIRNDPKFQENFMKSLDIFIKNNEFSVVHGYGPPENIIPLDECVQKLKEIYKNGK
jgi:hypothetical protein